MRRRLQVVAAGAGLAIALVLGWAAMAEASPADPTPRTFTQPDGSTFPGRLVGDEYLNGVETVAGFTVVQGAGGTWSFAEATADGRLRPSGIRPGESGRPPASAELAPHLRDERALATAEDARTEGGGPTPPAIGVQPIVVILAQFQGTSLSTTPADWNARFFGADQSVADYYGEASSGQLDLQPATESNGTADDGVVVVDVPAPHPNSGSNYFAFQSTIQQILGSPELDTAVDFDAYDDNGDGRLSPGELHLAVILAGTEAAQGCPGPSIWAHRNHMDNPVTADGIVVAGGTVNGGYLAAGELQCDIGPTPYQATLGILVHEFGHDLGLIDLYDVDDSSRGVDTWSVMAIHWLALDGEPIGTRPALPDPFSRWQVGWLTPNHITTTTQNVPLASSTPLAAGQVAQVRNNPGGVDVEFLGGGGTGEYFLVENRRPDPTTYDRAVAGCGLLVWHIDETRSNNGDDAARRVDVEEAGGGGSQAGNADGQDPYPSEFPANAVFNPSSSPSSDLNSGLPSGVALSGFSPTCGPSMNLDVVPSGAVANRPGNDRLANARVVRVTAGATSVRRTVRGHNVSATHQPGEPQHGGGTGRSSVWWAFRSPRGGFLRLSSESTFREVIAVYTGRRMDRLRRVSSVRGVAPGGAVGSPASESVPDGRSLGFRVERDVRYLIAVDSLIAGRTGGIRMFLDFDQARPNVRPVRRVVAPGRRVTVRVAIRNTSGTDRLQVYNFVQGARNLNSIDCPNVFVIAPGRSRTCLVRTRVRGPAGADLRGRVTAWIQWLDQERYSTVADSWFARVRS